jgi:acid stress-induced BolA-like protein IbaG/YrbA
MDPKAIEARIRAAIPEAEVEVRDTKGTGDHFEARVVSASFEHKTMVQQHQMVYAPLRDVLATGELHALALKTFTPADWARANGGKR